MVLPVSLFNLTRDFENCLPWCLFAYPLKGAFGRGQGNTPVLLVLLRSPIHAERLRRDLRFGECE
jgi:hypothetical protein